MADEDLKRVIERLAARLERIEGYLQLGPARESSRQEEAQRLGRILRPKSDGSNAVFYSVVTLGSRDQEFAEKRQLFLTEQGYTYEIVDASSLDVPAEPGAAT